MVILETVFLVLETCGETWKHGYTCTKRKRCGRKSATKLPEVEEQGDRVKEKCGCGRKTGQRMHESHIAVLSKKTHSSLYISALSKHSQELVERKIL